MLIIRLSPPGRRYHDGLQTSVAPALAAEHPATPTPVGPPAAHAASGAYDSCAALHPVPKASLRNNDRVSSVVALMNRHFV